MALDNIYPVTPRIALGAQVAGEDAVLEDEFTTKRQLDAVADQLDAYYSHVQVAAVSTLTVTHNLGKYPSVTLLNSDGVQFFAVVTHVNDNQVTITLGSPKSLFTVECN